MVPVATNWDTPGLMPLTKMPAVYNVGIAIRGMAFMCAVAVCCSVLQCVAVRCSVLQCVAVRCSVL